MFRPEIKVLDCTIRDGGLANDSHFSLETVRSVYKACCAAGVDYVELGYRNSRDMLPAGQFGRWRFCDEEDLRQAVEGIENPGTKIAIMQDSHKAKAEDLLPKSQSVVDMIRVATYVKDIDKAILMENAAREKGYETTVNIMSVSTEPDWDLDPALEQVHRETRSTACYVVDSYGSLYADQVEHLVQKYRRLLPDRDIGVHMHNNQQLAFANSIGGLTHGANFVDGTIYGLGRAAGNAPTELLLGFLKNPKYNVRPILDCVAETILALEGEIDWGYRIPHMVTGLLNQHPRSAMAMMKTDKCYDFRAFYDRMLELVE
ncbi:MAG: aldolase catalytic domain-containing protein [Planctomycetes bacterium]|nr:aldolase catalytic domain-containing protein [Planctomycetota bacterium]